MVAQSSRSGGVVRPAACLLVQSCFGLALLSDRDWGRKPGNGTGNIYYMHVPRTAGTSFVADAKRALMTVQNAFGLAQGLIDKEGCYDWRKELPRVKRVAMMLREPRSHVFSQYLMCGEGPVTIMTTVPSPEHDGLEDWLTRWRRFQDEGSVVGDFSRGLSKTVQEHVQHLVTYSKLPMHCYNPTNLQTQHLTCDQPFNYPRRQDVDQAVRNMNQSWFVGLTEAYQESICLFNEKLYRKLPAYCDCKNATKWATFKQSHTTYHNDHLKTRPLLEQPHRVIQMMDELTKQDQIVYRAARDRFLGEMQELEEKYSTTVLCNKDKLLGAGTKPAAFDGPPPNWRP